MSTRDDLAARQEARADQRRDGIAIIAMACRFPGAADPDALWQLLSAESSGWSSGDSPVAADGTLMPRGVLDGVDDFDSEFFRINAQDAELIDPQQRLFLACAFEALETAGKTRRTGAAKIGVFAGCGLNTYLINHVLPTEDARARAFPETARELQILLANAPASMPMRVSYALNLTGPSVNQQAACATGLVAVHAARRSLLAGECDMALAGAAAIRMPPNNAFRPEPGMILAQDGRCRAFDRAATGTIYGDGVGVVLLKRLREAQRDGDPIHAVLLGSAVNNDGSARLGFAAPSVDGQAAALSAALQDADIDPCSVGYVEAHGTGTPLGDPIEIAALALAYGVGSPAGSRQPAKRCAIGSVKTSIGHCAEAAGIAGLIGAVLALKNRTLPATRNFIAPNPQIKLDATPFTISAGRRPWKQPGPRRAGVSAFGMGGTNAHAILEEAPAPTAAPSAGTEALPHVLPLSARSPAGLRTLARRFRRHLCLNRSTQIEDICFSAGALRRSYSWRSAIVAASPRELRAKLRAVATAAAAGSADKAPKVAFLFAGAAGGISAGGRELYAREPVFRDAVERCDEIVRDLGADEIRLRSLFLGALVSAGSEIAQAQVSSFTLGYALSRMWLDWGVRPFAVLGHGFGEYTAACVAGVFEPAAALGLVIDHARLVQSTAPVTRLAVTASRDRVRALPDLHAAAARAQPVEAKIPLVSSLSGGAVGAEVTDPAHWSAQTRRPTQFRSGLATLGAMGADLFVDLAPDGQLAALARRCMPERHDDVLPVLRRRSRAAPTDSLWSVSHAAAALFERGAPLDWSAFHRARPGRPCHLPPTPFESRRHWRSPREASTPPQTAGGASREQAGGALPAALVDVAALTDALMSDASHRYAESIAGLEQDVPALIVSALCRLGGPPVPGARLLSDSQTALLPPERRRWISRLLAILEEEGLGRRSGDHMRWTARKLRGEDRECVLRNDSGAPAERALVHRVGERLAPLIAGEADPLETLFPGGSDALVAPIYRTAPPLRALNAAVAEVVSKLAARTGERPLRLIEIGAGTLATTRAILDRCNGRRLTYDVTDVGRSALAHAQRRLGHRDGVTVRRLDIERPAATQGFPPGTYDVVIAANILHATADLSRSLRHLSQLLDTGGTLIAVEGTAPMRWIDLTFGALPGWWRFEDHDIRALHPLLGARAWADLVARSGFADPVVLDAAELSPAAAALPQALIVARADPDHAATGPASPRRKSFANLSAADSTAPVHRAKQAEVAASRTANGVVEVIVQTVAEMLAVAPENVATDRPFDELGLDSLAMLELRTDLERRISRPIPLDLISAGFSVERLAAAITPSCIRPLRRDAVTATSDCGFPPLGRLSAGRPLVCLPSILGDFAALGPLARRLDDTVTTVGLDLTPLPDAERESIPARAARAARALRARWDDGPFTLIGHSYGGLLAYEVAHQLECSGGRIDLLAIVDIQADARTSLGEGIPEQARCLATVAELIARSIGRPMRLPPEAETATQIADRLAAFGIPLEPSGLDTLAARYRENRWALARYHPTPSHDLPILLLRAASRHPDDDFLPDVGRSAVDPNWGWQNLTSVKVTPVLLPGDHLTMLAEPHVGVLAGNLALHLTPRSVQAAHTESGVEQAAIGRS